jgi:sialidase-1
VCAPQILSALVFLALAVPARAEAVTAIRATAASLKRAWRVVEGQWTAVEGALAQTRPDGSSLALYKSAAYGDLTFSAELNPLPEGNGVRAAQLVWRSTGSLTYYYAHFDSKNSQVILVRSSPRNPWIEISRRGGVPIPAGQWSRAEVRCRGGEMSVWLNGELLLTATDDALAAGLVGLGTSQGHVLFRNLQVTGAPAALKEAWRVEKPNHVIVCSDAGAGAYEAFPDVVRLRNGDLLCVLYAGYGHVSLPNAALPKGGRICAVRSRDRGETWGPARIVYDDDLDNRDPHIAQLSDGTLICSFFSLYAGPDGKLAGVGTDLVRSFDGGKTWETRPTKISRDYYSSAPVRELPDGTLILGLYSEDANGAWGAVTISHDKGLTWSAPIDIGRESGHRHDAETDVCLLPNGDLLAVMRPCMCYAVSEDRGLTWSPSHEMGFPGHAPYLLRTSKGVLLVAHRLPGTALHYSLDDAATWHGPVQIDTVGGAYPSLCELPDGRIFCVYYEEGEGSDIRGVWLKVDRTGVSVLPRE